MLTLKGKTILISEKLICPPEQNILIISSFLTYSCYNSLQIFNLHHPTHSFTFAFWKILSEAVLIHKLSMIHPLPRTEGSQSEAGLGQILSDQHLHHSSSADKEKPPVTYLTDSSVANVYNYTV